MDERIESIISDMSAVAEDAKVTFGMLSNEQLNWKPGEKSWSVAQCLDHIIKTNEEFGPEFARLSSGARKNSFWENYSPFTGWAGRFLIKAVSEDSKKAKAPSKAIVPPSDIESGIVDRFCDHIAEVANYETDKILIDLIDLSVHHLDRIAADRVHLRMELNAGNPVAKIDQGCSRILLDNSRAFLHRLQHRHARTLRHRFVFPADEIVIEVVSVLVSIKSLRSVREHLRDVRRYGLTFLVHPIDRLLQANRVPTLENTDLPAESPLDGVIHLDDSVRDLWNAICRITKSS